VKDHFLTGGYTVRIRTYYPSYDKVKANAGAIVYLAHDGSLEIDRGLVREEDAAHADDDTEQDGDEAGTQADTVPAPLPASLVDLTAQKTAALRIKLRSPDTALCRRRRCSADGPSARRSEMCSRSAGSHSDERMRMS
jgi:hypothetical protein